MKDEEQILELHVAETNVSSGTIPVAWCVSKRYLQELAERKAEDPKLVICVAPKNNYFSSKEERYVVPLRDMMTYINFKYAGENVVHAFIVEDNINKVNYKFMTKTHGRHDTTVLYDEWVGETEDGEYDIFETQARKEYQEQGDTLTVSVPKEAFASEPPEWEKNWVNHLFENSPRDQCHYRKRRVFAYTVQPLLFVLALVVRLIALILSFLLMKRGFFDNIGDTFKLLTTSTGDFVFEDVFKGGSILTSNKESSTTKEFVKNNYLLIFTPLLWVPLILSFAAHGWYGMLLTLKIMGVIFGALGSACLLLLLIFGRNEIKQFLFPVTYEVWSAEDLETTSLTCDGNNKPLKVSQLPKNRRTVKLRFQELKSKVCRPFSR